MKTTRTIEALEREIQQLVAAHLDECHRAATSAVQSAFGSAVSRGSRATTQRSSARTPSATVRSRRTPEELAALERELYENVTAHPGAAMVVLAAQMGKTPRELDRPMTHLKRTGQVRSAGQRQKMRYFSMAPVQSA